MNILVRADSSSIIGTGHIMRDLVLAKQYKVGNIIFAVRELEGSINYKINNLPSEDETMAAIDIEKEFKHYLEIFTHDEELGKILAKVSFQELFNDKFLTENSKYTSMDDLIWRSGFGIMNLLEVEQVNQDKWNEYIARNTECKTWHEFGKLAMIDWMKHKLEEAKQAKN
mgnify:CR=1 FL=1